MIYINNLTKKYDDRTVIDDMTLTLPDKGLVLIFNKIIKF